MRNSAPPPGAVVGEMSLITGLPRTAMLSVEEESELLEFDEESFGELLSLSGEIPEKLAELSAARAEENKASFEKLAELSIAEVSSKLDQANILRRFLKMMGRRR
jgi:CRP-like cAMP-binding protein